MNTDFAVQLLSQTLIVATTIAAPVLITILVIGLLVNIGQVVTQLQEMTLSFLPKLIGLVILLTIAGPWMLGKLVAFALTMFTSLMDIQ